jgi:hypothetical protein
MTNMKLKYLALIGLLCVGMAPLARADLNGPFFNPDTGSSGDADELKAFIAAGGDEDANLCFKHAAGTFDLTRVIDGTTTVIGSATVTTTGGDGSQQFVNVSFQMNAGFEICGFLVKDGNGNSANIYTVTNGQGQGSGSFTGLIVPANGSGGFGTLSHLDIFCCPGGGGGVPDSGTTAMLLGGALTGLGVVRRFLKR